MSQSGSSWVLLALLISFFEVHGLVTGRTPLGKLSPTGFFRRGEQPVQYWFFMTANGIMAGFCWYLAFKS